MFKSCSYCGKIHSSDKGCPRYKNKNTEAVRFRNSPEWRRKRIQIKKRDKYLCQLCLRENYGGERQYNFEDLQVHHAVSIAQRQDLKLCDENLITICPHHHDMCERNKISVADVKKIIGEQEKSCCDEKIMHVT